MSVPQPRHNHQMVLMPACLLKDKRALQAHAQLTPQAPILTQGSGGCERVAVFGPSRHRRKDDDQVIRLNSGQRLIQQFHPSLGDDLVLIGLSRLLEES